MGCQEVRSLLSEYLDGEISAREGGMVKDHLAECEDCARELEILRGTAKLLLSVGEVEPPDGLLACIEAATIRRRTVRRRLRAALDPLFRLPVYARWTAASAAAAVLAIAVVLHPGIRGPLVVKPGSPRVEIAAKQPSPPTSATVKPAPRIEVAVTEEGSFARRPHRARLSRGIASSNVPARKIAAKSPAKAGIAEHEAAASPEPATETAPASEPSSEVAKASTTEEQPTREIKLGKAVTKPDWQQKEADALADLRGKLAARNKQRTLDVRQSPIEEKQYSVNLASVKF